MYWQNCLHSVVRIIFLSHSDQLDSLVIATCSQQGASGCPAEAVDGALVVLRVAGENGWWCRVVGGWVDAAQVWGLAYVEGFGVGTNSKNVSIGMEVTASDSHGVF